MRKQDFIKLVKHVQDKQLSIYEAGRLVSCKVMVKNDPNECMVHMCNDTDSFDFAFFEHDEYGYAKHEIDMIFSNTFGRLNTA